MVIQQGSKVKSRTKQGVKGIIIILGLVTGLISGALVNVSAQSAGTALYTIETSGPVTVSTEFDARLFVTATGANIYNGDVKVDLANLTFIDYSPASGNPFVGANIRVASSSTSVTVMFGHIGASAGSSGKVQIGNIRLRAADSAGTGQMNFSTRNAFDGPGERMTANAQNATITINAPAAPPSGGGGSSAGGSGSSSGGSTARPPANGGNTGTTNPVDNPNPGSSAEKPGEGAEIVSEDELSKIVTAGTEPGNSDTVASTKKSSNFRLPLIIGGIAAVLAAAGAAIRILPGRLAARRKVAGHAAGSSGFIGSSMDSAPSSPNKVITKSDDSKQPPTGDGPTIITPQQ